MDFSSQGVPQHAQNRDLRPKKKSDAVFRTRLIRQVRNQTRILWMGGSGKLARAYPRRPKAPPKSGHFQKKCIFGRDLAPQGAPKRPFGPAGSSETTIFTKNAFLVASARQKSAIIFSFRELQKRNPRLGLEIHAWGFKSTPGPRELKSARHFSITNYFFKTNFKDTFFEDREGGVLWLWLWLWLCRKVEKCIFPFL